MSYEKSTASKVFDLYEVRKQLVEEIKYLKNAKKNKTALTVDSHISAWEGFLWRIDGVIMGMPEIKETNGWKVGDIFKLDEFDGVLWRIESFPNHTSVMATTTSWQSNLPSNTVTRPLEMCRKLFKSEDEMEEIENKKRKKAKKKNKAEKEKKKFKIGKPLKEKKKLKKQAKNELQLTLFKPKKKKKKDKNKKKKK